MWTDLHQLKQANRAAGRTYFDAGQDALFGTIQAEVVRGYYLASCRLDSTSPIFWHACHFDHDGVDGDRFGGPGTTREECLDWIEARL